MKPATLIHERRFAFVLPRHSLITIACYHSIILDFLRPICYPEYNRIDYSITKYQTYLRARVDVFWNDSNYYNTSR